MATKAQKKETSGEISTKMVAQPNQNVKIMIPLVRLVEDLVELRESIKEKEEKFKAKIEPMKMTKDRLTSEVIRVLKERQEFSARFETATATLAVRKTAHVMDETAAIEALKNRGLLDYYDVRTALNELFYEVYAKEIAKGKTSLPGVEVIETEYLSIKTSEADERRKVTTEGYKEIQK